ncbi:three-Cys-motif partner protein TcmP [Kribbella sp. NBC_00359]|uniref:three-Cys-motif partner protein TcmP n=1 Tax=Kribbella sp. NBC_00359 TaxID=2975966 RepID=UPI002E230B76
MKTKDSDPEKWEYPDHTKAKHEIFEQYLLAWFPILASTNGRILVLDGFAGRGIYNDGSKGSPIIALSALLNHSHWQRMSHREFVFLFIEHDEENAASLQEAIDAFRAAWAAENDRPFPDNVKTRVVNGTFEQEAQAMCDWLAEQKRSLAPTFAFVDPFGWTGLPMKLLAELLNHKSCEVFINFMVGFINRFIEHPDQTENMNELFGLDAEQVLADFDGTGRVAHLRDVYIRQLVEVAGFPYVRWFAMKNSTGNVGYYLIHGTRHILGVEKMKDAMWKTAPSGDFSFSDRLAGKDVLFTPEADLTPLRSALLQKYAGTGPVMVKPSIEEWVLLETPYRKPHLTATLKQLEKNELIQVIRPKGPKQQFAVGVTVVVP